MAEKEKDILENIGEQEYKYGFTSDIETETIGKGLSEEVVRLISAKKGEPEWMTERRVAAYRHWLTLEARRSTFRRSSTMRLPSPRNSSARWTKSIPS